MRKLQKWTPICSRNAMNPQQRAHHTLTDGQGSRLALGAVHTPNDLAAKDRTIVAAPGTRHKLQKHLLYFDLIWSPQASQPSLTYHLVPGPPSRVGVTASLGSVAQGGAV